MSVKNATGIEIPSVFIGEYDGLTLKQRFATGEPYYIVITPDAPFNINTHLLLPFAIVVAICFIIMIIFLVSTLLVNLLRILCRSYVSDGKMYKG